MLHRLCEPPSIPLSFSLATILPRRGTSRFPLSSAHRLRLGLPGYLIPFATLAFASQRQKTSRTSLSPRAFLPISTHFTAPPEVPGPPTSLQTGRFGARSPVEPGDFSDRRPHPPTRALSPVIPNNVRTVRLTAAAGTNLARASSRDRSRLPLPPPRQEFTTRRPSSSTRRRSVRLAPIAEDSRLQPPVGVWAVSQSQCAGPRSHAR
jgi:hypothetical protein